MIPPDLTDPWDAPVDVATAAKLNAYGVRVARHPRRQVYVVKAPGARTVRVPRADAVNHPDVAALFLQRAGEAYL